MVVVVDQRLGMTVLVASLLAESRLPAAFLVVTGASVGHAHWLQHKLISDFRVRVPKLVAGSLIERFFNFFVNEIVRIAWRDAGQSFFRV